MPAAGARAERSRTAPGEVVLASLSSPVGCRPRGRAAACTECWLIARLAMAREAVGTAAGRPVATVARPAASIASIDRLLVLHHHRRALL